MALDINGYNDRTREIFKNAIVEMFGVEAKIPASVKKAMMLGDYGCGRPLTAWRILCVKDAIDANGAMRRRRSLCLSTSSARPFLSSRQAVSCSILRILRKSTTPQVGGIVV